MQNLQTAQADQQVRGYAKHGGGTLITFVWPCGHKKTRDYGRGAIAIDVQTARAMADRWSLSSGGVDLPTCHRCG